MNQNTAMITFADGIKIVVPDSLNLITPYVLLEQGDWFEDEIKFVRKCVQPGDFVVDIGANFGVFALSMAKVIGPTGQLWAFEPASTTAGLLLKSIEANEFCNIHLEQAALSNRRGTARLGLNTHSELNAIVSESSLLGDTEEVQLFTLDQCAIMHSWRNISFVKIDAEGEEANIIEGGSLFFENQSPLVQYEVKAGSEVHLDLIDAFQSIGYESYRLVPGLGLLVPFDKTEPADGFLLNLFCCKEDRASLLEQRGLLVDRRSLSDRQAIMARVANASAVPGINWRQTLGSLPYGSMLIDEWSKQRSTQQDQSLDEALSCYALSRNMAISAIDRYVSLKSALSIFTRLCSEPHSGLRLSSLARVAREFGARSVAVAALAQLSTTILRTLTVDTSEAFLLAEPRFDNIQPGQNLGNMITASILEAYEKIGSFSSFYTGESARQRLVVIRDLGFGDAEMNGRLALLEQRFGS